ncbi:MAG TPA: peptide ABC transporter substrate-binding protein [Chloroflexia bacterium]
MPSHQPRVAKFTLLLLGLLLILPACGPLASAGPVARLAATGSPTAANLKAADQVFTLIGSVDDPPTLDPALASDSTSAELIRHLFSGLVRLDDTLAVVPDLAAALPELSADGRTYTFHLRPGVRWPDGRAVTADDVRYSLERATDPALAAPQPGTSLPAGLYLNDIVGVPERLAGAPGPLKGVNVLAPDTIALTISTPRAYFLQKLVTFYVVDQRNVEAGGREWYRHPQGTGPFRLQDWRSGDRITLVPNPTYYGGAPHLRQVNFLLGEAATGGLVQYEQGLIDFVGVPADDVDRVQDPAGPLHGELHITPGLSTTYLGFNMNKPPFDDPKVREAFSLVVNRDKIARVMFNGRVEQAAGIVPTALPGYLPAVTVPAPNIARARQLLAESRYHGASGLPRIAVYSNGGDIGPMLQQVFKDALGVEIEVRVQDWAEYLAGLHRGDYQAFISGWEADWPEPSNFLEALFRSTSPENETGLRDPEVDSTLDRAAATPDPAPRYALYAAAEQRALAATPLVPLFHSVNYELLRSYVHGVTITPLGILNLKDAYIDRGH